MAELQRAQRRRRRNTRVIPIVVVVVLVGLGLAALTGGFGGSSGKKKVTTATTPTTATSGSTTPTTAATTAPTAPAVTAGKITGATPCPKFDGSSPHVITFAQPPPTCITTGKTYTGTFNTNLGTVTVQFDTTKTPQTANNFIVLSLYHYFDQTAMFRTDTSIGIIQGGSPHTQDDTDPGPGYTIKDEGHGYTYAAGDLVMARTSAANSAGSQYFFCVTSACSNLNSQGTYVVFGHVTSGLSVLQNILNLNENLPSGTGAPKSLVLVKTLTISQS